MAELKNLNSIDIYSKNVKMYNNKLICLSFNYNLVYGDNYNLVYGDNDKRNMIFLNNPENKSIINIGFNGNILIAITTELEIYIANLEELNNLEECELNCKTNIEWKNIKKPIEFNNLDKNEIENIANREINICNFNNDNDKDFIIKIANNFMYYSVKNETFYKLDLPLSIEDEIKNMKLDVKKQHILFTDYLTQFSFIIKINSLSSDNGNNIIKSQHQKIKHIDFAKSFSSKYNLIIKYDTYNISGTSLQNYIDCNPDEELEWNNIDIPFIDKREFVVSVRFYDNKLIVATYKNLYYTIISRNKQDILPYSEWIWENIEVQSVEKGKYLNVNDDLISNNKFGIKKFDDNNELIIYDENISILWNEVEAITDMENSLIATTIDGRIFRINEGFNMIAGEIFMPRFKLVSIIELNDYYFQKYKFYNKFVINVENIEEEKEKLLQKKQQLLKLLYPNYNTDNTDGNNNIDEEKERLLQMKLLLLKILCPEDNSDDNVDNNEAILETKEN